jgi:hypothetical protein
VISVEARGRLGNHMFQFAFGLGASTRLGTDFAMNDELLHPEFRLGPWRSPTRRLRRSVRFHLRKRLSPAPVVKIANTDDADAALATLEDGIHYAGFFQSERYFAGVENMVRAAFEPYPQHVERFRDLYDDLARSPYVCCHIRRTDYVEGGWDLPISFYEECLALARPSEETPVVFVGDDLREARRAFEGRPGFRFEQNDEIVDLQLIVNATAVVTSNSSFGWWGSWLGAADRPVYAPRHWLGFRAGVDNPRSVIPPGWQQVSVPE